MARNPVIHSQIIATLAEFGDFEECTGGEAVGIATDYFESGRFSPRKIQGTHSYTDLVLTRAYDPQRDARLFDWASQVIAGVRFDKTRSVVKTTIDSLGIPRDRFVYSICRPLHVKYPDAKAGDSSIATLSITMSVESVI